MLIFFGNVYRHEIGFINIAKIGHRAPAYLFGIFGLVEKGKVFFDV